MSNKRGLGRGLDAFFGNNQPEEITNDAAINEIAVKDIMANKYQPRRVFDEEALNELSSSIKQYGVIQPVVVRKTLEGYELVAGERRLRASQMAGLKTIPAVVKEYTDSEMTEIALIENLQRQDLNPIEEAMAFRRLMEEFGLTQEEVAQRIGRSRSLIANIVRLLNLPLVIQDFVSRGTLSIGQARPILALESSEVQIEAAQQIIDNDLSAREAEELVKRMAMTPRSKRTAIQSVTEDKEFFMAEAEDRLKLILGTQVRIKPGKLKSKIEIEYYSDEDLERLMEVLTVPQVAAAKQSGGSFIV